MNLLVVPQKKLLGPLNRPFSELSVLSLILFLQILWNIRIEAKCFPTSSQCGVLTR